ncbi:alpha/beta hydrolase [Nocardia sp. NPDC004860]|uniref:alpha/beta fold hydrolase n=1 Tax=Nocardia sp. NPDC004860 TaxID=3154557 RepID=UPI0033B54876
MWRRLLPLFRTPAAAHVVQAGIRAEATARRTAQQALSQWDALLHNMIGPAVDPQLERIRALEYQLEPDGHRLINTAPGRRPVVHWHESGAGEVVLLLNGWTASGLVWPTAWINELSGRYRVVRVDNRGSGWSRSAPSPFTIAELADDAAAVLSFLGVRSAIVLGYSMGGMIAQELALRYPGIVRKLVLVGTKPPIPEDIPAGFAAFASALAPPAEGGEIRAYFRALWSGFGAPGFADQHPDILDEIVEKTVRRPTPRDGVFAQLRAVAGWSGPQRLRALSTDTIVVHGDVDPLMPVANGPRLAELIPHARYLELPGVGHLVAYEAGEVLTDLIDTTDISRRKADH